MYVLHAERATFEVRSDYVDAVERDELADLLTEQRVDLGDVGRRRDDAADCGQHGVLFGKLT